MPPVSYNHLPGLEGRENKPGLMKNVYIAPLRELTLAEPVDSGNMDGSSVEITSDHTFADPATQGWVKMYTTLDSAQLIAETIGERDGRGTRQELTAFRPGMSAWDIEFANVALYDEFVVLVETLEGDFLQMGTQRMGVECTGASADTGTVSSGRKGYTFTFEVFDKPFIYSGAIAEKA